MARAALHKSQQRKHATIAYQPHRAVRQQATPAYTADFEREMLQLHSALGNQAAGEMATTESVTRADVEYIAGKLKEQILTDREEQEIVDIIKKWAILDFQQQDDRIGNQGSPYLDRFLLLLKLKNLSRRTARSGWIEQHAIAYDLLWHELQDERLEQFKSLVSLSKQQGTAEPEASLLENFWLRMGKEEAIGVFGILKGMGTAFAGTIDEGAWAITKALRAAGLDVADPTSAADWLATQYDISGEAMFGKEWQQGEKLLLGKSAAEIGTAGGGIIWGLVTTGAGKGAPKWAKTTLAALGISANLKGVEDSVESIADLILKMQDEQRLSFKAIFTSAEFWVEATKLAGTIYGAVSGATTSSSAVVERIEMLLEAGEASVLVGRLVEIGTSDLTPEQKEQAAGDIVVELFGKSVSLTAKISEYQKLRGISAKQSEADARRWNDPGLSEDEAVRLYQEAGVQKPLGEDTLRSKYRQGWRFDPSKESRRWKKPVQSGKKPMPSTEPQALQVDQTAERAGDKVWSRISGDLHYTRKHWTAFANVESNFMPPRQLPCRLADGIVLPAEDATCALLNTDSKVAGQTVGLTRQISRLVVLASKTKSKTLVLIGAKNIRISKPLQDYARKQGVKVTVQPMVISSGDMIKG